jgi:hypothetical protein
MDGQVKDLGFPSSYKNYMCSSVVKIFDARFARLVLLVLSYAEVSPVEV